MKKNNRWFIGSVLIVLVAAVIVIWWSRPKIETPPAVSPQVVEAQKQKEALDKKVTEIKSLEKSDPTEAKKQTKDLLASLPEKMRRRYEVGFTGGVEDIAFYGQIIDQYGVPVVGARVMVEAGGRYLAAGSGRGIYITDDEGRFYLKAKGGNLSVGPIEHPEITEYRYRRPDGQIGGRPGFTGYQHVEGGNDLIWSDYTQERPYIFNVWRVKPEDYEQNIVVGRSNFFFDCQGNPYTVDLTQPDVRKRKVMGKSTGQFLVKYTCQEKDHHRDVGNWSIDIEVIDGGIIETDDIYLNRIPNVEFESNYKIEMVEGATGYDEGIRYKRFYFVANNNRVSGSLILSFLPYGDDKPLLKMDYKVNPTGGRSLVKR